VRIGTNHWWERLILSFSHPEKLRQRVELLENTNQELSGEIELRSTELQEQIARQAENKKEFRQQIERRNQIIGDLQNRVSKQQDIVEKLTKRLETIQLEKDEVYEQYNRLFNHISASERPTKSHERQMLQTGDSRDEYLNNSIEGRPWFLNMGCGKVKKSGYLNVDIDIAVNPDLVVSLDPSLPFASATFTLIELYHVMEHVYPWVGLDILKEFWRILKPGGTLAIECPNIESACSWLVQNSDYGSDSQMGMWAIYGDPNSKSPLQMHKWGYTPITLAEILKQSGFVSIQRKAPETHVPARDFRITGIKPA
jgi:predicted SAM-dependent methyltransferase